MNIKTWVERAESLSDGTVVMSLHLAQFKQAEINELRTENAQLKTDLETRKSNYNRLKAMVDDRSISGRTFSLCEELEKENARLRVALGRAADDIESWGAYASSYFQEKWNLQADIDAARSALGEKS